MPALPPPGFPALPPPGFLGSDIINAQSISNALSQGVTKHARFGPDVYHLANHVLTRRLGRVAVPAAAESSLTVRTLVRADLA